MTDVSESRGAAAIQTRGSSVEAWHHASVAVVDDTGRLVASLGDPTLVTATRSALKPFQALALVESGARRSLGVTPEELAITTSSHSGMAEHVQVVSRLLQRSFANASALQCGAHLPIGYRLAHLKPDKGEDEDPLRHNCSGKHAGFLALAHALGEPLEQYLAPGSRTQTLVLTTLSRVLDVDPASLPRGTDGCSAPNYALPLTTLARGALSLRLARARDESLARALAEIRDAMLAHPRLVSGEARFDNELMSSFPSNALSKSGAEAIQMLAFSDPPLGIAIKIHDGASRPLPAICLRVLEELGLLSRTQELPPLLARHRTPKVKNDRKLEVGKIETCFELIHHSDAITTGDVR